MGVDAVGCCGTICVCRYDAAHVNGSFEFYFGPTLTGAHIHGHPGAWNGLVSGRKRWVITPPHKFNQVRNISLPDRVCARARECVRGVGWVRCPFLQAALQTCALSPRVGCLRRRGVPRARNSSNYDNHTPALSRLPSFTSKRGSQRTSGSRTRCPKSGRSTPRWDAARFVTCRSASRNRLSGDVVN